jgi:hypothetical protein
MHVNELKYAALVVATGMTGNIQELEHEWLTLQGVPAGGPLPSRWYKLFATTGHHNEAAHKWLTAQAVSPGALPSRWYEFWTP